MLRPKRNLKPGRAGEMLLQRQKELRGVGYAETRQQEEIAVPVIPFDWFTKPPISIALHNNETKKQAFEIKLNSALVFHKVYCYMYETLSTPGSDFFVLGELAFLNSGAVVGQVPLSIARNTGVVGGGLPNTTSAWNACTISATPIAESIKLVVGGIIVGQSGLAETFVSPAYIEAQADEAVYNVLGVGAPTGIDVQAINISIGIRSSKSR